MQIFNKCVLLHFTIFVKCNKNVKVIYILLMIVQTVKEKWKND